MSIIATLAILGVLPSWADAAPVLYLGKSSTGPWVTTVSLTEGEKLYLQVTSAAANNSVEVHWTNAAGTWFSAAMGTTNSSGTAIIGPFPNSSGIPATWKASTGYQIKVKVAGVFSTTRTYTVLPTLKLGPSSSGPWSTTASVRSGDLLYLRVTTGIPSTSVYVHWTNAAGTWFSAGFGTTDSTGQATLGPFPDSNGIPASWLSGTYRLKVKLGTLFSPERTYTVTQAIPTLTLRKNETGSWVTSGLSLTEGDRLNLRVTNAARNRNVTVRWTNAAGTWFSAAMGTTDSTGTAVLGPFPDGNGIPGSWSASTNYQMKAEVLGLSSSTRIYTIIPTLRLSKNSAGPWTGTISAATGDRLYLRVSTSAPDQSVEVHWTNAAGTWFSAAMGTTDSTGTAVLGPFPDGNGIPGTWASGTNYQMEVKVAGAVSNRLTYTVESVAPPATPSLQIGKTASGPWASTATLTTGEQIYYRISGASPNRDVYFRWSNRDGTQWFGGDDGITLPNPATGQPYQTLSDGSVVVGPFPDANGITSDWANGTSYQQEVKVNGVASNRLTFAVQQAYQVENVSTLAAATPIGYPRFSAADPRVSRTGTWTEVARKLGPYDVTALESTVNNSTLTFDIAGNRIHINVDTGPTYGQLGFKIGSNAEQFIDLYSSTEQIGVTKVLGSTLGTGSHHVVLRAVQVDATRTQVAVNRIAAFNALSEARCVDRGIPANRFCADFYGNPQFIGSRIDTSINSDWGTGGPSALGGVIPPIYYVAWYGDFDFSGANTFRATANDGIFVIHDKNGRFDFIIDAWRDHDQPTSYTGVRRLNGRKRIMVAYYKKTGGNAVVSVKWWRRATALLDFDGRGTSDFAVWRPSNSTWYVRPCDVCPTWEKPLGEPGDVPVPGDYDGDGKTDVAVFRPRDAMWRVALSGGGIIELSHGVPGDLPVPGDYNGDGKTDFAIYRPSTGLWSVRGVLERTVGDTGTIPVPGDYDGDSMTDLAIYRPSNGGWVILQSSNNASIGATLGDSGTVPVPGDYDGDGKTDLAVHRISNGGWVILQSSNNASIGATLGDSGTVPVPGDYDGDGKTDLAVWRSSTGAFSAFLSKGGSSSYVWGQSGDIPLSSKLLRPQNLPPPPPPPPPPPSGPGTFFISFHNEFLAGAFDVTYDIGGGQEVRCAFDGSHKYDYCMTPNVSAGSHTLTITLPRNPVFFVQTTISSSTNGQHPAASYTAYGGGNYAFTITSGQRTDINVNFMPQGVAYVPGVVYEAKMRADGRIEETVKYPEGLASEVLEQLSHAVRRPRSQFLGSIDPSRSLLNWLTSGLQRLLIPNAHADGFGITLNLKWGAPVPRQYIPTTGIPALDDNLVDIANDVLDEYYDVTSGRIHLLGAEVDYSFSPGTVRAIDDKRNFIGVNDLGLTLGRAIMNEYVGGPVFRAPQAVSVVAVDGDIILNSRISDSAARAVLAHEVGHFLGCGHSGDPDSVMYPSVGPNITPDVEFCLELLYPNGTP